MHLSKVDPNTYRKIWEPIPNSSQALALDTRAQVTLYTGARGPGKTDTQLMRFRRRVGLGYGSFWRGIIFDQAYKNLDDLISKSKRWFNQFGDGAKFLEGTQALKWVWPTGEELLFRAAETSNDYWDYHGQEFPFIGWNELAKYPTSQLFDMMFSINRSSWTVEKDSPRDADGKPTLPPIPLEVFATTNPYGAGHIWCKRRFIDVAPYGKIVRKTMNVYSPAEGKEVPVTRTQVAIFGSYRENIYLDPVYIATLMSEPDPNRRKAWLGGSWDIVTGGAIDDVWKSHIHILPRFVPPKTWKLDRSLDWGSTHPYHVGWWAEANGEEATMLDGTKFCPPPGTLILVDEIYGSETVGTNVGSRASSVDVARAVKAREIELMRNGWILKQPKPGPADNQINNVHDTSETQTIAGHMLKEGIAWTASDKSPGSRKIGLQLARDRLQASMKREGPGLYFMDNCRISIATIPVLPRDEKKPDDVQTKAEDHAYDSMRYRVLDAKPVYAMSVPVKHAR